jgi:hypothetical protein
MIEKDADLKSLRGDAAFAALIARARKAQPRRSRMLGDRRR